MGTIDVSVVIPTSPGREEFLVEAVESVLAERGLSVEVIVVADGPGGGARTLAERVADPRVRCVARDAPSGGRSGAVRNAGVPFASGRYLHFLDDDDKVAEGGLSLLATALDAAPRAGMAFGRIVPFGGTEEELAAERRYWQEATRAAVRTHRPLDLTARMLFRNALLACSACIVRGEAFAAAGGFDESLDACVDGDLYLRVIRRSGFAFVDRPVLHRRIGHSAVTRSAESGERYRRAYRSIHGKYRRERGALEFYAMKIAVRLADLALARGGPPGAPGRSP